MGRWIRMLAIVLTIFFALTMRAHATTYYVAANGSDSNSGTSETSPWLHAPGMPNCTATCASKNPQPGDSFIFRGGDAWHRSANMNDSNDVYMGGEWTWSWSGSLLGVTCNYPTVTTTCIYIGVNTNWYNSSICGSSFCRPQLELDNPIWANSTHQDSAHPGFVTACTYDDWTGTDGILAINISATGVTFDNWNIWGLCWTQKTTAGYGPEMMNYPAGASTYDSIIDSYVHGWTEAYNPQTNTSTMMDLSPLLGGSSTPGVSHNVIADSVFDGADSCPDSTVGATVGCTGGPIRYGDCYDVHDNVIRWMSNGWSPCYNPADIHDNLWEHMYESYDPSDHGTLIEAANPPNDCPANNQSWYNNTVRNTNMGVTWEISTCGGYSTYIFNNVFWNVGNSGNCDIVDGTETPTPQVYFTNNTVDGNGNLCMIRQGGASGSFSGEVTLQNNHMVGPYTAPLSSSFVGSGGGTVVDDGNEVLQTESAANEQGYTPGNNYQPTSANGATVGKGANLSLQCVLYSADSALCSGSTGGVTDSANSGLIPVLDILQPVLRGSSWDAGAYQYSSILSSCESSTPCAPTGLVASVQ